MKKLLSVYDAKINSYKDVFTAEHSGAAIRGFEDAVNNPKTELHQHPEDFYLYELGQYDAEQGLVIPHDIPIALCKAMDFKKPGAYQEK